MAEQKTSPELNKQKISRREFLKLTAFLLTGLGVSSCIGGQPPKNLPPKYLPPADVPQTEIPQTAVPVMEAPPADAPPTAAPPIETPPAETSSEKENPLLPNEKDKEWIKAKLLDKKLYLDAFDDQTWKTVASIFAPAGNSHNEGLNEVFFPVDNGRIRVTAARIGIDSLPGPYICSTELRFGAIKNSAGKSVLATGIFNKFTSEYLQRPKNIRAALDIHEMLHIVQELQIGYAYFKSKGINLTEETLIDDKGVEAVTAAVSQLFAGAEGEMEAIPNLIQAYETYRFVKDGLIKFPSNDLSQAQDTSSPQYLYPSVRYKQAVTLFGEDFFNFPNEREFLEHATLPEIVAGPAFKQYITIFSAK